MDTVSPVLLLALVAVSAVIVGVLLATIFFTLSGRGRREGRGGHDAAPTGSGPASVDEQALLCVSRIKGNLTVSVRGQTFRHLQEITDPQLGLETAEAIRAVMAFAKGLLPTPPPATPPPAPKRTAAEEAALLERLRQAPAFVEDKPKPPRLLDQLAPPKLSTKPLRTPAEEINELLQRRLQRWPDLVSQRVEITTREDGSLCIRVGLQTFKAVDEVSDPQVRALIKDVIREWESAQRYP